MLTIDSRTLRIIWGRIDGGLTQSDYKEWAYSIWQDGHETSSIVEMACADHLSWQEQDSLFERIITDLGYSDKFEVNSLLSAIETELLRQYNDHQITGEFLVQNGYRIWMKSDHDVRYRVYADLDEDISVMHEVYAPIFYKIDPGNVESSIRTVLRKIGKCG